MPFQKPACRRLGAEDTQEKKKKESVRHSHRFGDTRDQYLSFQIPFLQLSIKTQATVFWANDYVEYWLVTLFSLPGSWRVSSLPWLHPAVWDAAGALTAILNHEDEGHF